MGAMDKYLHEKLAPVREKLIVDFLNSQSKTCKQLNDNQILYQKSIQSSPFLPESFKDAYRDCEKNYVDQRIILVKEFMKIMNIPIELGGEKNEE